MLSQIVHSSQSPMNQYYKQKQIQNQELIYSSKKNEDSDEESHIQQSSNTLSSPQTQQNIWIQFLLRFFFGRMLFIRRVLKNNHEKDRFIKQKIIIMGGLFVSIVLLIIGLYYGLGNFFVLVILLGCLCLYFYQIREQRLQSALISCEDVSSQWSSAYRQLYKYIKQIEIVYAQINLKQDEDFKKLLEYRQQEPIQKRLLRPRVACLEIRRLLIQQIRRLQKKMVLFMEQIIEKHNNLRPKQNIEALINFEVKPTTDFYTLNQIKTLHSSLALLKYQVKQMATFIILNSQVSSFVVYQTLQEIKEIQQAQLDSSRVLLAMLFCYQNQVKNIKKPKNQMNEPRKEIIRCCKQKTHLLNIYYNQYLQYQNQSFLQLALSELRGIVGCLQGMTHKKRNIVRIQQNDSQMVVSGGVDNEQKQQKSRKVDVKRLFYLDDKGQTIQIQQPNRQELMKSLQQKLLNKQEKKKQQKKAQVDQRIKFNFLDQLKLAMGQKQSKQN